METKSVKTNSPASSKAAKGQFDFKLSYCEFMTLYALLANATSRPSPAYDMYEKLLHHIMVGIYKKFFFAGSETRNDYTVELSSVECIAFWLYWTDHAYSLDTPAGKVLDKINTFILLMFTPDPFKN